LPRAVRSILTASLVLLGVVLAATVSGPTPLASGAVSPAPDGLGTGAGASGTPGAGLAEPGAPGTGQVGGAGGGGEGQAPEVPDDARQGYYVLVLLDRQVVKVYLDGCETRSMVCSAGLPSSPTPTGRFYLQNRGEWFYSEKYGQGAWWWVSFRDWGVYLFHSVPTDKSRNVIPEEAAKLGQPASHGCVRLSLDDARWFYENLPQGTPVDIR